MDIGNQFLGTERIGKLMGQYAVPCIISLLVGALYNIVDQIFIANASYLGSYGNAANTVVFPLTVVALGIAVFIGDGCCAFVSITQLSTSQRKESELRKQKGRASRRGIAPAHVSPPIVISGPVLCTCSEKGGSKRRSRPNSVFVTQSFSMQS